MVGRSVTRARRLDGFPSSTTAGGALLPGRAPDDGPPERDATHVALDDATAVQTPEAGRGLCVVDARLPGPGVLARGPLRVYGSPDRGRAAAGLWAGRSGSERSVPISTIAADRAEPGLCALVCGRGQPRPALAATRPLPAGGGYPGHRTAPRGFSIYDDRRGGADTRRAPDHGPAPGPIGTVARRPGAG